MPKRAWVAIGFLLLQVGCASAPEKFDTAQRGERWPVGEAARPESNYEAAASPRAASEFTMTPHIRPPVLAAPPAPGFTREYVAWSDGGYDSTWTTKAPYEAPVTHRIELRAERASWRIEDVPEVIETMVLVCIPSPRTRYQHFDHWAIYAPGNPMEYQETEWRPCGAPCVLAIYNQPWQEYTVQRVHPYAPPYREWR